MADKVILTLEIDGAERQVKNIKELQKALEDARSELLGFEAGSKGFQKAQKNVAELTGKLGDLGDAARIEGTHSEQLSARWGLFNEALATGDMDKAKLALGGIGGAMKAIPLIALVEGFRMVIENFSEIVDWGKNFFNIVSDSERAVKSLNTQLENQQHNNKLLIQSMTDEIGLMAAQGKSEEEIIERKKQITALKIAEIETQMLLNKHKLESIKNEYNYGDALGSTWVLAMKIAGLNDQAIEQNAKLQLERIERQKEVTRLIENDEAAIAHLKASLNIEIVTSEKKKNEELKALRDEESEKRKAEQQAEWERVLKQSEDEIAIWNFNESQRRKRQEEADALTIEDIFAQGDREAQAYIALMDRDLANEVEHLRKKKALHEAFEREKYNIANAAVNATKALSDALFVGSLNNVKKGSSEELKVKKNQFNIDKGISIAKATIDGVRGVQAQFAAGPIIGPILAAAVGITTLANIMKIKNTKFEGGSIPSVDSTPASMPSPTIRTPDTVTRPAQGPNSTSFNESGNVIKVVNVETESTSVQDRIIKLKNQATFG